LERLDEVDTYDDDDSTTTASGTEDTSTLSSKDVDDLEEDSLLEETNKVQI
jgi:hypothetical protein